MIALLQGQIVQLSEDSLILSVNGVGYEVSCSGRTLSQLGGVGEAAQLFIYTHVREDTLQLFGFADQDEKAWFNLLTGVQGVGAKMGLNVLSTFGAEELATAIAAEDEAMLTRAHGVGKKLAGRLVQELKDKVADMPTGSTVVSIDAGKGGSATTSTTKAATTPIGNDMTQDAVSALVNLGYSRSDAFRAVSKIANESEDDDVSLEQLIQQGLKRLSA